MFDVQRPFRSPIFAFPSLQGCTEVQKTLVPDSASSSPCEKSSEDLDHPRADAINVSDVGHVKANAGRASPERSGGIIPPFRR
jgi:hypothetical protein